MKHLLITGGTVYDGTLRVLLRFRYATATLMISTFLVVGAYASSDHMGMIMMPEVAADEIEAGVRLPVGTTPAQAARVADCVKSAFNGRRLIVFSGGAKKGENSVFDDARAIRDGGGNGSIIGRNTFQRPRADAIDMLNKLIDIYKGKA